ncbi:cytochrome c biogenesis heme-transporting ATPase CcmA [Psychrosphaera ytuae]|uniref:Cytochrome c biogenesis heme-transporting ATPase CcmA n=1 Tax=Psychrosphaera ytuae TaxID=2820710 RepID=A0A975HH21_9GAMM|nr:cytochrome c biogenesis heme-transporting ATPase CcmA [Psychrosphaera ytuae]QTH62716.1 cytochrome c biogenesis heme-transporting ATPase CcmA [Psychrosphaera ytuae]
MEKVNSTPLLRAEQLTCIKQDRILFEHLDVAVYPGDIIQVAGPNGAGKTSLLRILAGLAQPHEGQVLYNETPIGADPEQYHQSLLYIGHKAGVKAELSAEENLQFSLALHQHDANQAEALLESVGLLGFEDSLAAQLSAGQHRRISLAQLWSSHAKVWILDEPFTAIDVKGVAAIEQQILSHAQQGGCVILTTHQPLSLPENKVKTLTLKYRV